MQIDNIDSGNDLVPLGNKPLPEPVLTQICVSLWDLSATLSNALRPEKMEAFFRQFILHFVVRK